MPGGRGHVLAVSGTLTLDTIECESGVFSDIPGGSALYAAAAASLLVPVQVIGTVGNDYPFDRLTSLWARGVDRTTIGMVEGPTFRWHARYTGSGDQRETVARDPGVTAGRLPVVPEGSARSLLLGSTSPAVQAHVLASCHATGVIGLDSMAHHWRDRSAELHALLPQVDLALLDEDELELATGTRDAARSAEVLHARGPSTIVVKRGSRGAWVHRRGQQALQVNAVTVERAVDPTGAGDAFAGAFLARGIARPEAGLAELLCFATALASFAVEAPGVSALVATELAAVERRMRTLTVSEG